MAKLTLKKIMAVVKEADPGLTEDDEAFKAQVVMLASLQVGPNIRRLRQFTGYPEALLNKFSHNLRKGKVWRAGRVYGGGWFEEGGGVEFTMDSLVAMGLLERRNAA